MEARDPQAVKTAAELLKKAEKAPAATDEPEEAADPATYLRDRLYYAMLSNSKLRERDPAAMIAGLAAFYSGLVMVFLAGVLLYRRTPESNLGRW